MLSSDSLAEWVQVDDNNINGRNVVLINGCHVLLVIPLGQDATMHSRVQCLRTACKQQVDLLTILLDKGSVPERSAC